MLKLKVTKPFLDNYRQYKIDRVEGILPEDIQYTTLEHLLNKGKTLSYLYDILEDYKSYYIDVIDFEISDRVSDRGKDYHSATDLDLNFYLDLDLN